MKTLEKGQEKIDKICKVLREETLEPAKLQAEQIREEAKVEATRIIAVAKKEADALHEAAKRRIEQERSVFHSSLLQAAKQSLEGLRQDIEKKLFHTELESLVSQGSRDPLLIAKLLESLIRMIDKEGSKADLSAVIPETVSAEEVSRALGASAIARLQKGGGIEVGHFKGGVQLKWHDRKMTLDITDEALVELMAQYVRKDFRELLFGESV